MSVKREVFGRTKSGKEVHRYWLENSKGMKAGIVDYGAILVNLFVPDKRGNTADVVLGFDTLEPYFTNGSFFGATVGPNANRISKAMFIIDGKKYQLDANDKGNNLHSHWERGYHKRIWEASKGEEGITFFLEDGDGNMGFPGKKKIEVTYTVTENNELKIQYKAESDKRTIINMTNHTYFNLAGHNQGKIYDHVLELRASAYTPVYSDLIPTGEIVSVIGTPFDFTKAKKIGEEIGAEDEQIKIAGGYDHNWAIDGADGSLKEIAVVTESVSGRCLKVYTDLPGVQFYAGNFIDKKIGKENAEYGPRSGFCLETQYFPDAPNKPNFPSSIFGLDKKYKSTTIYQFCS